MILHTDRETDFQMESFILANIPEGLVVTRASDGIIIYANSRFEAMFGYQPQEMRGLHFSAVNARQPEDSNAKDAVARILNKMRSNGSWRGEVLNVKKDGTHFWNYASVSVFAHPVHGEIWVALHWDITQTKREEERFRSLLEAAPDAMIIVNREGEVVLMNAQAESSFGYSRHELIGKSVDILVPAAARDQHVKHRALFSEDPVSRPMGSGRELKGIRHDGSEFPIEISLSKIETPDGVLFAAAIRDITDRKQAEATQLHLTQEHAARVAAEEASTMKSTFIGLLSHELKSPLAALEVNLLVLLKSLNANLSPAQDKSATAVQRSSRRLAKIVDSILEYFRVESGKLVARSELVDLRELVNLVVHDLQPQADEKRLTLSSVCENDLPPLRSDATILSFVLHNLVENAVRYTPQGSVSVHVSCSGGAHRFSVRDSGPGIAAADQDRMFLPFEQLEPLAHKHSPGVGLGLALVRSMVSTIGGRVELKSAPGEGSVFTVTLGAPE